MLRKMRAADDSAIRQLCRMGNEGLIPHPPGGGAQAKEHTRLRLQVVGPLQDPAPAWASLCHACDRPMGEPARAHACWFFKE